MTRVTINGLPRVALAFVFLLPTLEVAHSTSSTTYPGYHANGYPGIHELGYPGYPEQGYPGYNPNVGSLGYPGYKASGYSGYLGAGDYGEAIVPKPTAPSPARSITKIQVRNYAYPALLQTTTSPERCYQSQPYYDRFGYLLGRVVIDLCRDHEN